MPEVIAAVLIVLWIPLYWWHNYMFDWYKSPTNVYYMEKRRVRKKKGPPEYLESQW